MNGLKPCDQANAVGNPQRADPLESFRRQRDAADESNESISQWDLQFTRSGIAIATNDKSRPFSKQLLNKD